MRQSLHARYLQFTSDHHALDTSSQSSSNATTALHQYALFTALCLPDETDISRAVNASTTTSTTTDITHITASASSSIEPMSLLSRLVSKYSFELKEFRIFLYQLLGQAATHKMLNYCEGHYIFICVYIICNYIFICVYNNIY